MINATVNSGKANKLKPLVKVGFNCRKDIASGLGEQKLSYELVRKIAALSTKTVVISRTYETGAKKSSVANATYNNYLAFKLELADKQLSKIDGNAIAVKQGKRRKKHGTNYRRYSRDGQLLRSVFVK